MSAKGKRERLPEKNAPPKPKALQHRRPLFGQEKKSRYFKGYAVEGM